MTCFNIIFFVILSTLSGLSCTCDPEKCELKNNVNKREADDSTVNRKLHVKARQLLLDEGNSDGSFHQNDFNLNDDFKLLTPYSACEPYKAPPTPDFSAPGRRISAVKCAEYMWQMKLRLDKNEHERKCLEQQKPPLFTIINGKLILRDEITKHTLVMGGHDVQITNLQGQRVSGAVGWISAEEGRMWKFMCGSTLISPNFALTAGHCSRAHPMDTSITDIVPKIVRFGVEDIVHIDPLHMPVDKNIARIILHPQYESPKKYFDMALLQLDSPLTFNKFIQPACLYTGQLKVTSLEVTGWGKLQPYDLEGNSFLQVATIDVVDSTTCNQLLQPQFNRLFWGLQDHQFCAGQMAGGVDACQGDSGGPLQMKIPLPLHATEEGNMHYIVGMTSFGSGCGIEETPAVYANVSQFADWIESVVWK